MTGLQALQAVQYVNVKNRRYVVMEAEDWEALLEWIETVEDLEVFQQAQNELKAAGGDPDAAGWLCWDDIRDELA
ncbi:MAG: hypothetical protein HY328_07960 [Chloroflexi bacterium]|nr:hypothetical protein [Chloroflexota bacterium]